MNPVKVKESESVFPIFFFVRIIFNNKRAAYFAYILCEMLKKKMKMEWRGCVEFCVMIEKKIFFRGRINPGTPEPVIIRFFFYYFIRRDNFTDDTCDFYSTHLSNKIEIERWWVSLFLSSIFFFFSICISNCKRWIDIIKIGFKEKKNCSTP